MEELRLLNRRNFLKTSFSSALLLGTGSFPYEAFSEEELIKLTVLSTNDVHSRIEPFPMDGGKWQGLGGVAQRASLIKEIRAKEKNVLLLDAGDIFQGTPYFNFFGGELEMKLMSEMGYDAATIGNHDFDAGLDGLVKQLPNANFPLLCGNYDFSDTVMNGETIPYKIFHRGKLKIGVFAVCIELAGLVPDKLFGNTKYLDPIAKANELSKILKKKYQCNLVICLSHLGWRYKDNKVSDEVLAKNTRDIDLIIGGHTHTFMDEPKKYFNLDGKEVLVSQAGWAGIQMNRIDFFFNRKMKKNGIFHSTVIIGRKSRGI